MIKTSLFLCSAVIFLSSFISCQNPKSDLHKVQNLADSVLLKKVIEAHADSALIAVMETRTGRIIALSCVYKTEVGFKIQDNRLLYQPQEPGSIFNPISILAALENGASLDNPINLENGECKFFDRFVIRDQDIGQSQDKITLREALLRNSNIAAAKTIHRYFGIQPGKFRKALLHMSVGQPYSGDTLEFNFPWIGTNVMASIGYGFRLSPLQMLTFYNAMANNGNMMMPFCDSLKQPQILHSPICSTGNLERMIDLFPVYSDFSQLAGQCGISQLICRKQLYCSSFCGYFPKEKPTYSIISYFYHSQPVKEFPLNACSDIAQTIEKI